MSSITSYISSWVAGHSIRHSELGRGHISKLPHLIENKVYTRGIEGTLRYNDDTLPDVERKINFFVKDFFGVKHYVGSAKTDENGYFRFRYNWSEKSWFRTHEVVMGLVENRRPFSKQGLWCAKEEVEIDQISLNLPLGPSFVNIGDRTVNYEEIPADLTKVTKPPASQSQSLSYYYRFVKAALPEGLKRAFVAVFNRFLSNQQVQHIYDSFGPKYPKYALTPQNLIFELLNEICAVDYARVNNRIIWTANWDGLDFDIENSLPNVQVVAELDSDNRLELRSISVQFRGEPFPTTVIPGDDKLQWAIYLARSTFALKGEAEVHLADGHILPGIPAKAFYKYIKPENPLFNVLAPHLSQLDYINYLGSQGVIFGKGSVLDASALSDNAVAQVIIRSIQQKSDYIRYQPLEPINGQHFLAIAEKKHYELLLQFFTKFIADNREGIHQHWDQVYRWSEVINKRLSTIPKITERANAPTADDEQRLAKICAWLVNKTTFIHWAAHSRQQLLTDIRCASLSIQHKALDNNGNFDPFGNTNPSIASQQDFISRFLLNFEGDSFFKNPYGDINPELLALLTRHKNEYTGYRDIEKMHLTTQI